MELVWIWVLIIGNGQEWPDPAMLVEPQKYRDVGPWRPDVPRGVFWRYDNSIPLAATAVQREPKPLTLYARIGVRPEDVKNVVGRVAEQDVPAFDRAAISLAVSTRTVGVDAAAEAAVGLLEAAEGPSDARNLAAVRLVEQARAYGLAAQKAQEIAERHKLGDVETAPAPAPEKRNEVR